MKKINLLIIAIVLFAFTANAQRKSEYAYIRNNYNYYNFGPYGWTLDDEYKINSKYEKRKVAKAGIKEFTQTNNCKKKEYIYSKLSYDTSGNCLQALFNKKNGKLKRQFKMDYSPKNRLLSKSKLNAKGKEIKKATYGKYSDSTHDETVVYRRGKEIKKSIYDYGKFKQFTAQEYYRHGKLKKKITSTYDSTRILESYYYKHGSPNYKRKWVYSYYDDKTKKSSVIYKANGKVKYTWKYDCKPEGEMQAKHKDTTLVCEKKEYDIDSNITYTYRSFDESGEPHKQVYTYSKDRKLLQQAVYHDNDIPSYFYKYNKVTGEYEQQIYYNNKGIERFKMINAFDANNNNTETCYYNKGKMNGKYIKQYNSKKLITSNTIYDKKNKLEETDSFNYTYF